VTGYGQRRNTLTTLHGGLGRELEVGNPAWCQQQELLAHGENPGSAAGTVQRMVESARLGQR